ncbi:hypothetical protein [Siphonobacter sp.]|uniref:hypothetical protein n=1 Tax=Siphonobacter sp. TaxID=1869184 RepID=UPI003B3B798A
MALALGLASYRFSRLPTSLRYFWGLLLITLLSECVAFYARVVYHHNLMVYNTYWPLAYALATLGYAEELRSPWLKRSLIFYGIFYVGNILWWQPFHSMAGTNSLLLSLLLTSVWALWYFQRLLQQPHPVFQYRLFWISCGFLLFNATCLPLQALHNTLGEDLRMHYWFDRVGFLANIALYACFALTFVGKQERLPLPKRV